MAGIAAMVLTGILGTAMGLNNTAAFMSSCVAFVAVSHVDGQPDHPPQEERGSSAGSRQRRGRLTTPAPQPDRQLEAEQPKREGRGT